MIIIYRKALKHYNEKHKPRGVAEILESFLCGCGKDFCSLTTGGRHHLLCGGASGDSNCTAGSELGSDLGTSARRPSSLHLAIPKLDGKVLVMEYPGSASRCPYEVCDFVTREVY